MPSRRPPRSLARRFAVAQRHVSEVLAVELEEIESVQHRLAGGAAAVQSIEDRHAIRHAAYVCDRNPRHSYRVLSPSAGVLRVGCREPALYQLR
jgi:hypothetical protein